jgi:hypothetical protein
MSSCEEAVKNGYGDRDGFKCCNYCGSMDPVQLADLIEQGQAIMHGSDWKYGWPHKFYVDVKNPKAGQPKDDVIQTFQYGKVINEVHYPSEEPEFLHAKFYSNHLALLDDETFEKVAPIISNACGVVWEKIDGKLHYRAPYFDYQK